MATGSNCKRKFESVNDLEIPPRADIADVLTETGSQLDPSEKDFILDVTEKILQGGSLLIMMASDMIRWLCFLLAAYFYCRQFQLPVLFISPLVALIKRKGMLFRNLSLRVECLYEGAEIKQIMKQVNNRTVDVLLLTPEMLEKILLNYTKLSISFACIDNAECVLKLQAYRPSYLRLNKLLRGLVGFRSLMGLSALATESTTTTVMEQFGFRDLETIQGWHSPVIPRNVQLRALCSDENGKLIELLGLLCQEDQLHIIVLCDSGDTVESVFKSLQEHFGSFPTITDNADITDTEMNGSRHRSGGHQEAIKRCKLKAVKYYLSTMLSSERQVVEDGFENNQIDIVVTTPDLGMGLTRADAIIYCCMPQTYESLWWGICHVPRFQPQGYVYVLIDKENDLKKFRRSTMKIPSPHTIEKQVNEIFTGEFMPEEGFTNEYLCCILARLESDNYLELPEPISDCRHLKEGYHQPSRSEIASICKTLRAKLEKQAISRVKVFKQLYECLTSRDDSLEMLAKKFSYGKQSACPNAAELVDSESTKQIMGIQKHKRELLASSHHKQRPESSAQSRLDEKPRLIELTLMKTSNGKGIKIIKSVASKWQEIATMLDFDDEGEQLKLIAADKKQSVDSCREIFMYWLSGNGRRQPATWRVLIEVLEDCDFNTLANKIKDVL